MTVTEDLQRVRRKQGFYIGKIPVSFVPIDHIPSIRFGVLSHDFTYVDAAGRPTTSYRGMLTDGLSIPRILWRIAGPPYRHEFLQMAAIHDGVCYKAATLPVGDERDALRLAGDRQLLETARFIAPDKQLSCRILYLAVRAGGLAASNNKLMPDYQHEPEAFWRHHLVYDAMQRYRLERLALSA